MLKSWAFQLSSIVASATVGIGGWPRSIGLAVLALASIAAIGCTSQDDTASGGTSGGDTVTIGAILPFTGDLGIYGQASLNSFQLAFDIINEAGGVNGKQIRVVHRDSATSPQIAVDAANALLNVDGAAVILGAMSSSVTLAVAQGATIPEGIPLMTSTAKSPAISTLDDNDMVFRTSTSDELQGGIEADIATSLGFTKMATIYINNAYGEGLARVFAREFEANGGTITEQVGHESGQPSYQAELKIAKESGAEALHVIAYPESAELILRESAEGEYFSEYMFADTLRLTSIFDHAGWDHYDGTYGTSAAAPDSPHVAFFNELYESEYGEPPPDPFTPFGFDAAAILALAIEHAGSEDPIAIRDAFRVVSNPPGVQIGPTDLVQALEMVRNGEEIDYTGAAGLHDFDENGDSLGTIEIWQVKDGEVLGTGIFLLPGDPIPELP